MNSSFSTNTSHDTGLRCGWELESRPPRPNIFYLDFVSYPILLVIASAGNLLNFLVLGGEKPRTSKNVYLLALAIGDFLYMWGGFLVFMKTISSDHSEGFLAFFTSLHGFCTFTGEMAAFTSDWTVVAFSVDRFIAVKSPLRTKRVNAVKQAAHIVIGIIISAFLITLNRLVDYYWFIANDAGYGPLPLRPWLLERWHLLHVWLLALLPILTFLIVLLLNGTLLRLLVLKRRARAAELQVIVRSSKANKPTPPSDRNASVMLAVCVMLYLSTQSVAVWDNGLEILDRACVRRRTRLERAHWVPVKNFLMGLNYSLNFVLYCALNPSFRRMVKAHLNRSLGRSSLSTLWTSLSRKSVKTTGRRRYETKMQAKHMADDMRRCTSL
ncbi:hypothetical protein RvY_02339 [Ramazzottius varieornatus]|uniref:G-protein coupled receptors family 1 profile domain-containing protein n=1 Tax=Ramazzottius varieornatus TaxID=947166 RepID=A0A1D1URF5_RAMVA|nr:hypothetical protein RvY_02339 [Ramazzottius varieornatus]